MKKNLQKFFLAIVCLFVSLLCITACSKSKVEFKVNFIVDNAVYATLNTSGEEIIKMPENPVKENYDFDGWYWDKDTWRTPFTANSLLDAPLSSDMNVYSKWKPKSNDDDKEETKNGLSFKTLTVDGSNVYGKVSNATETFSFLQEITASGTSKFVVALDIYGAQQVATKTIPLVVGDNTVYIMEIVDNETVKMYTVIVRRRPIYTVSFNSNGGTKVQSQQVEEDGFATAPTTTRSGYTASWNYDFTKAITKDTYIKAVWAANTDTKYKIEYYWENIENNEYTLHEVSVLQGTTDTKVTAEQKSYAHFTFNATASIMRGNIAPDGTLILKAFYTRDSYNVTFKGYNNEIESRTVKYGGTAVAPLFKRTGYTLSGWGKNLNHISADITVTAQWTANTDTKYSVQYYLQNLEDNEYTLYETVELKGTTDTTAFAEPKTIAHFTHFPAEQKAVESGNISPDGSLFLKIFYTRNSYTVTFDGNDGNYVSGEILQSVKYEGSAVPPIFEQPGYGCEWDKNFANISTDLKIVAKWNKIFTTTYTGEKITGLTQFGQKNYTDIIIYSELYGKTITSIGSYAFEDCSGLTSITIPDSVTSIGDYAFHNCSGLTSITIGNGVTSIGKSAFYNCSGLTSITIPNGVDSIGYSVFNGCSGLTSITIPDSVTSIGEYAFSGCSSLESMTIPFVGAKAGVTSKDTYQYPFGYIFGSVSYTGGTKTTQYYYGYSISSTTSDTYYIPSSLKNVMVTGGKLLYGAFNNCRGLTNITIGNDVTSIGNSAFSGCNGLTSITIPDSVTSIGSYAFSGCSGLTSITIPDSVTSIGSSAFSGCSGLTSITIPDSVTFIGDSAFEDCSGLTSITIPDSVTSIGNAAFSGCNGLTSITIPDSVTSIGDSAFSGCHYLKSIYITDIASWCKISGLSNIMRYGSSDKKLYLNNELITKLVIPNGVTSIGEYAFNGCSQLTSITIPDSVTSIGDYAFKGCSELTSITIPDSVTSIGNSAFYNCSGLTSITIPDSVTSIGNAAFSGCSSLESMTIPFVGAEAGVTFKDTYQYPFGYIFGRSSYTGGTKTRQYYYGYSISSTTSDTYYIPSSLKNVTVTGGKLLYGAFYDCSGLTSITITNSVTSIGDSAFNGCSGLTSITIPDSVTSIGNSAFSGCSGLTSITIPDSVTSIGNSAFSGCSSLESMTIPFVGAKAGVTSKDTYQYPFGYIFGRSSYTGGTQTTQYYYVNSSRTSDTYYIPSSLKNVTVTGGKLLFGAFENCSRLTNITIPNSVTSIGSYAFYNCHGLTSITIPDSVTSIGNSAFYNCHGLTSITIPDSVTSIGNSAFNGCSGLTSITIPDSVTSIGNSAFSGCSSLESMTIPFVGAKAGVTSKDTYQYPFGYIFGSVSYTGGTQTTQYYYVNSSRTSDTYYIPSSLKNVTVTGGKLLSGAFYNCSGLTSITIGNDVDSIGDSAFSWCSGLTSIAIGNGVTSIGDSAFYNCDGLTSIVVTQGNAKYKSAGNCLIEIVSGTLRLGCKYSVIPTDGSVTSIGNSAFENCHGLTSIKIPDSVTSIGNSAFYYCSGLTSIIISDSVTSIGSYAFYNCYELTSIKIPDSVTSIGNSAFNCSGLTSIIIPDSVTSIGEYAFSGCHYLDSIYITDIASWCKISGLSNIMRYGSSDKKLYLNNELITKLVIPNGVDSIGEYAFNNCSGLTSITIPNGVDSIGYSAFKGCSRLTSITIPDSVTSIGNSAFYNCSGLTSITIPDSVTSIGDSAFNGCSGLTSITIGNGVTSIGYSAFSGCSGLTSITIPDSVTSIDYSAFNGCSRLTSITIPDSVTSIDYSAFNGCSRLTSITIPDSVTYIGHGAFNGCSSLESMTIPFVGAKAGVTSKDTCQYPFGYIFGSASYGSTSYTGDTQTTQYYYVNSSRTSDTYYIPSSLKNVTVTGGKLLYGAFYNCSGLTSITIGNGVDSIGSYAFYYCSGLTSITIPNSVTSIGDSAFNGCSGLTSIVVMQGNAKFKSAGNCLIEIESGTLRLGCKYSVIPTDGSVTSIGDSAFENCRGLTSITIPDSVTSIGDSAFKYCDNLKKIIMSDNLTYIGFQAFGSYNCIEDGEGMYYLGNEKCSYLYLIKIGYKVTNAYINSNCKLIAVGAAWSGKSNLMSVRIPNGVTIIGDYAFRSCSGLTSITIPGSVTSIGDSAFYGCSGLTSITIPDSVTSIGNSAFENCSGLTNITIPNSVKSIGDSAFV